MTPLDYALAGGIVGAVALRLWLAYRRICRVDEIERPMGRERVGL